MGRKVREVRADGTSTTWQHSWTNNLKNALYQVTQKSTGTPAVTEYFDRLGRKIRVTKVGFNGAKIYEDTYYNAKGEIEKYSLPHYAIDAPEYVYSVYDILGRVIEVRRPGADGEEVVVKYSYDNFNVTTINAKGHEKTIESNIIGQKTKVIEGESSIEYSYDPIGNLIKTVDSEGNSIVMSYDVYGNKIGMNDPDMGVWSYTYNALGELVSQTDAKGQVKTMTYDKLGRLIKRSEPEGETTWTYDRSTMGVGKLSYVQNDEYRKEYYYDNYGRTKTTKEYIDNNIFQTDYIYNAQGKLEKTISPDGFITVNEYNEQGYLSAVKTPKQANSKYSYEEIKEEINKGLEVSLNYAKEAVEYNNKAQEKYAKSDLFLALAEQSNDEKLTSQLRETAMLAYDTATLLLSTSRDAQAESSKALRYVAFFLKEAASYKDIEFYEYVTEKFRRQTYFYIDLVYNNLNSAIDSIETLTNDDSMTEAYRAEKKALIKAHIEQSRSLITIAEGLSAIVISEL